MMNHHGNNLTFRTIEERKCQQTDKKNLVKDKLEKQKKKRENDNSSKNDKPKSNNTKTGNDKIF